MLHQLLQVTSLWFPVFHMHVLRLENDDILIATLLATLRAEYAASTAAGSVWFSVFHKVCCVRLVLTYDSGTAGHPARRVCCVNRCR
jgi:hypothetical protein